MSTSEARMSRMSGFGAGALLALLVTALCFVLVLASDLTNDDAFYGLLVGSGLIFLAGVALALVRSLRPVGLGLMVGAAVAFLIEWGVLILLITSVTN
jgi:hypothetical protein